MTRLTRNTQKNIEHKRHGAIFYLSALLTLIYLSVFNIFTLEWLMATEIRSFSKRLFVNSSDVLLVLLLAFSAFPPYCHSRMASYVRRSNLFVGTLLILGGSLLLAWQAHQVQHIDVLKEYGEAESELGIAIRAYIEQPTDASGERLLQALRNRSSAFLLPDELWNDRWDVESQRKARQLLRGDYVSLMDPRDPKTPSSFPIPQLNWWQDLGDWLNFGLHRQLYLLDLINAARKESNIDYLKQAKILALDWIRNNPLWFRTLGNNSIFQVRNNLIPSYAWIDDTTSNRAMAQLALMFSLLEHDLLKPDEAVEFLASFVRHGRLLGTDKFYSAATNHGVMQNRALLALALVFPELSESRQWIESALRRMEQQITQNVSSLGVHRELSVSYHFYVLRNFIYFLTLGEMHGITLSSEYEQRVRKMLVYAAEIVYPDGTCPLFGDTSGYMPKDYDIKQWPHARYKTWPETGRLAAALAGTPPSPETLRPLWEDPGIVHIRYPGSKNNPDILDVTMLAAQQRPSHNHFDALSLFLYRRTPLLVGPGYPTGPLDHTVTQYALSTTGHNTISVDGRDHNFGDAKITQLRVLDLGTEGDRLLFTRATHPLYDGVLITRDLLVLSPDLIVLIDRAKSKHQHRYRQHFHFPSGLTTLIRENQVSVLDNKRRTTLMRISAWLSACDKPLKNAVPIEEVGYEILPDRYANAPSIAYGQDGDEATFVTTIDFGGSKKTQILQLSADSITVNIGDNRITLRFDDSGISMEPISSNANDPLHREQ